MCVAVGGLSFLLLIILLITSGSKKENGSEILTEMQTVDLTLLDFSLAPDFTLYGEHGANFSAEIYEDPVFGGPIVPFTKTRRNEVTIREIRNDIQ